LIVLFIERLGIADGPQQVRHDPNPVIPEIRLQDRPEAIAPGAFFASPEADGIGAEKRMP